MTTRFENIIIIGRPGSGKSEVVDLLRKTPVSKRTLNFHVGNFVECDDFIFLNEKLKEDDIWEETGSQRRYSKKANDGRVITNPSLWTFAFEMLGKEVNKHLSDPAFYSQNTLFIEFSRGGDQKYATTLSLLSDDCLSKSAILHLDISYQEALSRNVLRFKSGQEDTTLHHKVPLEQMEMSYKTSDWNDLSQGKSTGFVTIKNQQVPFISLKNEPAPANEDELKKRIASSLHTLFNLKYGAAQLSMVEDHSSTDSAALFDHLFVFGRPASGKSEFIDFIRKAPTHDRAETFHIGELEELDDYCILAEKFNEDELWQKIEGKRKFSVLEQGVEVVTDKKLYDFAAHQINQLVMTRYLPNESFYEGKTLFIEFSRGGDIGYEQTLHRFHPEVLQKGAVFYVKTSFDECWRRNVARFEEKKKHSVLAHMVPRSVMERMYLHDDWDLLTKAQESGEIEVNGVTLPFVTLNNEVESKDPVVLRERYKKALDALSKKYQHKKESLTHLQKKDHFNNLFVFGRPAVGKSEFIESMKNCEPYQRRKKFGIAPFEIIDDFLFYVELSETEGIFEKFGIPRRVTKATEDGVVVTDRACFDLASEKINRHIRKKTQENPSYFEKNTRLIEFSRGDGADSYEVSLKLIDAPVLSQGAIIYIKASYQEAMRRNESRYQEKLKHSVLAHKVPEEAMERFYRDDDWDKLTHGESHGHIEINGVRIPFVTLDNEVESKDPSVLDSRYEGALQILLKLWMKSREGASSN